MVDIQLSEEQKACNHSVLKVEVSGEYYRKGNQNIPKVEIFCTKCYVRVAHAGGIYFNNPGATRGIILEHWPRLLEGKLVDPDIRKRLLDTIYQAEWHFELSGGIGAENYEVDMYRLEKEDDVVAKIITEVLTYRR